MAKLVFWFLVWSFVLAFAKKKVDRECSWKYVVPCGNNDEDCDNKHCFPCVDKDLENTTNITPTCKKDTYVKNNMEWFYICGFTYETTDVDIVYQCVKKWTKSQMQAAGYRPGVCKYDEKTFELCHWRNCDEDCYPCNESKEVDGFCYRHSRYLCGADEWIDKDDEEKGKRVVPCIRHLGQRGLNCNNLDGGSNNVILVNVRTTRYDAATYCRITYGTSLVSLSDVSHVVEVTNLMRNYNPSEPINYAWIGLQNTHKGGWWVWDDGSCCDNIYGACTDGNRWVEGHPIKHCEQHQRGKLVGNINQNGYINNDIDGDELLPFFCNCPHKFIDACIPPIAAKIVGSPVDDMKQPANHYAFLEILSINVIISVFITVNILCCVYCLCLANKNPNVKDKTIKYDPVDDTQHL
eukprot:423714_1